MPSKRFISSLISHPFAFRPLASKPLAFAPLLLVALSFYPAATARAQAYTSIVVIGDSLTDVGNDTAASAALYGASLSVPSPGTGYTQGRFTDGTDTSPAAVNFRGVWAEQLALLLPNKPVIKNSLAGGTDYAYGFAFTGTGTTAFTYGPNNVLSFNIQNMGLQLSTYLATKPTITATTLFIVWGGANDLLNATTTAAITTAAANEASIVQQLIAAGATNILVPNLPPLGLVPRLNGTPAAALSATQASAAFNQALAAGLTQLIAGYPSVHIYQLDIYTLFNTLVGPPIAKGLANVTAASQGLTTVNPDTYLFWDGLHPTTYGHSLVAAAAFTLLGAPVTTTTALTSSNAAANLNASVTLTATVTGTGTGTPMGTLTFYDGTTVLSSSLVTGSTAAPTVSYTTTTLAAGTHPLTAKFVGVNNYVSSSSTAVSEVVTAPALTSTLAPSTLTISSGATSTSVFTLNPVGGYSGTATFACGALPARFACYTSLPSLVLKGDNAQQSEDIIISTGASASLHLPNRPGASNLPEIISAFAFLPFLGIAGLAALGRRRTGLQRLTLLLFLALGSTGAIIGLSGCSNGPAGAATGTYTIPVTLTINGTTTTQTLTVVVQ